MGLTVRNIKAFCKQFEGKYLTTLHRKTKFRLTILPESIIFTPVSSNKPRIIPDDGFARVIERYKDTHSLRPTDYRDLTYKASYVLTILQMAENESKTKKGE